MKKILALLGVAVTLFSLSACKFNKELTPEEIAAEQSKAVAQSEKKEQKVQEGVDKKVDKLGKTEKGERLVVKEPDHMENSYIVFEFDRKGVVKAKKRFTFCSTQEMYDTLVNKGDGSVSEVVDHDKSLRLVVYNVEIEKIPEFTFDYFYEMYSADRATELGYSIIE